ncbi:MAG: efflux RND transporter permease subunit [Sinobacteraceae bacterium]|nr:efflux RND transporter permease subunit [Nevskiaceae bacterium]MCP5470683.1 efflux RND transporter permease subunit [Nevskiaceae bacterium]
MNISEVCVRRPVFATVLSLLLVLFGLIALDRLAVREYPDISRPVVSITTIYGGASAVVVENKITQVIEDRVAGIEGILKLESDSEDERSSIRIEFDVERDIDAAANDVRDRISRVIAQLPPEADPPQITKADASAESVMFLSFSSEKMTALEVTDYADRYIVDRLSTIPGVARVSLSGGRRAAMRIWIDRQALAARALTVGDIESALRRENVQLPAGRLESQTREFSLRTEVGLDTEQDFRNLTIGRGADGHLVRLGEVADVQLAAENTRSTMRTNGRPGVGIGIEAQSKANVLDIVRGVRAEVARMQDDLPPGASLMINVDNGISIEAALREVLIAIAFAFVSVLLVIFVFLGSIRSTLIPALTIPVSITAACMAMYLMGYSINVLTLLGIALAIGLVVDDAIVVLENIHRRAELGEASIVAAINGSREIGFAVIATTLTLIAVFVPISFLPGDVGRLFREFGLTLAAAVAISALVALTLTPMMASKLPPASEAQPSRFALAVEHFFGRLSSAYETKLRQVNRRPWLIVGLVLALSLAGLLTFRALPSEFTPRADIGRLFISVEAPEGASFEYTESYGRKIEDIVSRQAEKGDIRRVTLRLPGAISGTGSVNSARVIISMTDWHERQRSTQDLARELNAELLKLPGVRAFTTAPGGLRAGWGSPVQAVIGGPDYEQLAEWSAKLTHLAEQNPGLTSIENSYKPRKPQIRVAIDRDRAADLGVSLQTVGRTLETVLGSRIVTTYIDRGREYNVILQGKEDERATITDLTNIQVRSDRTGELIPLASIVELREMAGATRLSRFNRLRAVEVNAGLADGYTMGEAVQWFEETVKRELPSGATLMWDGDSGDYVRSSGQLYLTFLFAVVIVFLVLAAQFESFVHPTIIMTTVPLALLGAVFGLKIQGLSINIFSQIAVIMLIGIAAKNGVLIVEFANQLRDRGVEFGEAIVKAAAIRLRPVLMTSLCTAFGAIPFLLASGAGAEQRLPIGVVVFYGTMLSVLLTLLVVPAVYSLVARRTKSTQYTTRLVDRLLGAAATGSTATPTQTTQVSTPPPAA